MPTHKVNLDALIRREPFEFDPADTSAQGAAPVFKLDELENHRGFHLLLRKPDFQRTTYDWTPQVIAEFIRSFLDGEVIPAIIVWQSQKTNKIYIIDGSHRVSALMAFVNDDYGDGERSQAFCGEISQLQQKYADETRELIKEKVGGSYAQLDEYKREKAQAPSELILARSRAISGMPIAVQAVIGDAKKAEGSFIRINGSPAVIDRTALDVIRARFKPNAIATHAIISAGQGYKYWGKFADKQERIEKLAKECYGLLFGDVVEVKIDSSDVPRGGQPYSQQAFTMVLDLVNMFNGVTPAQWQTRARQTKKSPVQKLPDDADGTSTVRFLETVKLKASYASGREYAPSLGLDPAVYCYGNTGTFHTGAFLASRRFVLDLHSEGKLEAFTDVRQPFEEFLVAHKSFINQLSHAKGSRTRSVESILAMLKILFVQLQKGQRSHKAIIKEMRKTESLKNLVDEAPQFNLPIRKKFQKAFDAAAVLNSLLEHRETCPGCKARIPPSCRSREHKTPKEIGGMGTLDNYAFMHPFCNQLADQKRKAKKAKA